MRVLSVMGLALVLLMRMSVVIVNADQRGLDYPHNNAKGYACDSCHYVQGAALPAWITSGINENDLDDTRYNKLCWGCHNNVRATFMPTHSNKSEQAVVKYGKKWSLECRVCHWPHHQKQTRTYTTASYLQSGAVTLVGTNYIKTGMVLVEDALIGNILIPNTSRISYQYKIIDNTTDTIMVSPNLDSGVVSVGNTFAVIHGMLIKSTIKTPNSGDKAVKFFRTEGTNSFADGGATRDGICVVCHTKTTHYRNDGTGSDQSHDNLNGKNGANCLECHTHENGFKHAGGGSGSGCGDATSCHGLQYSHPAHVAAGGNLAATCSTCHDTAHFPNFKHAGICDDCHHDGTYVATGVKVAVTPPAWETGNIGCNGCHGNGPSYSSDSPKANSHPAHKKYTCDKCHSATTTTNTTITNTANHLNDAYNLQGGAGITFTYTFNANGGSCSNISCHGNTNATWGGGACLGCHAVSQGNRVAAGDQFGAASHHVQGIDVTNEHCYQCHWEANADGRINLAYHQGSAQSGAPVDLVMYGAGNRPATYVTNTTAIAYTANNGNRTEIAKITKHCLSCHSDKNNFTEPFGDCNTPMKYAWDYSSIDARYSQAGTTLWGKYSVKNSIRKAYSAHGNAVNNAGGYDAANGLDGNIANTRAGSVNIQCFDCHNSHGSNAAGVTSSYISFNNTKSGGILKATQAGKGGYSVSYIPSESAGTANNPYNAGAALCFDCHFEENAVSTPWGYKATFGATKPIKGYADRTRFGTGEAGRDARFTYRQGRTNKGGHMMRSFELNNAPDYQINGLCTPCHDPHGVSPSLGTSKIAYGVPLLKGTWLTSPYTEDRPTRGYSLDRNIFGSGKISEDDTMFAGLCLVCHPKTKLTDETKKNTSWKSRDRIHETVKGWGNNAEHNFPCAKCHTPHNAVLPKLMQTNCLDYNHRGNVVSGGHAGSGGGSGRGKHGWGSGSGAYPLGGGGPGCHAGPNPGTWPDNQKWNNFTPW